MKTTHIEISDAQKSQENAHIAFNSYIDSLRTLRHNEFVAKGGCDTCNGYGRVCTWSTLDGSSWDEFGVCPNATCTAKVTGKDITKGEPGTGRSYITVSAFAQSAQEKAEYARLEQCVETAKEVVEAATDKWTPAKGKEVEVIRGTKGASKGDKGMVFWTGVSEFQPYRNGPRTVTLKVGFKNAEGIACWTTGNSCVVVNPHVAEEKAALVCAIVKRTTDKAYLMTIKGKDMWVPKSICKKLNDVGYMLPHWFMDKNGLR